MTVSGLKIAFQMFIDSQIEWKRKKDRLIECGEGDLIKFVN